MLDQVVVIWQQFPPWYRFRKRLAALRELRDLHLGIQQFLIMVGLARGKEASLLARQLVASPASASAVRDVLEKIQKRWALESAKSYGEENAWMLDITAPRPATDPHDYREQPPLPPSAFEPADAKEAEILAAAGPDDDFAFARLLEHRGLHAEAERYYFWAAVRGYHRVAPPYERD